jgi:hypothetical protein
MNLFHQSAFLPTQQMVMEIPVIPKKVEKMNPVIILKSSN